MRALHGMLLAGLLALAASNAGCSEAVDDGEAGGGTGDSTMSCAPGDGDGDGDGDGGSSGEGPGATSGAGGSAPGLVINELSAAGDDWIELFNAGTEGLDVGGLALADSDAGVPKLDDAVTIPAGTTLEPGAYLFVLADQDASLEGFQDACDPGPAPCLHAGFGLSAGDGDTVFILDGDAILASNEYPPGATADGESWARLPNGTGDFAVAVPTPGAANAAP